MAAGASAKVLPFPERRRTVANDDEPKRSLTHCKDQFTDAVSSKYDENLESAEAERYFHGVQWTSEQLKTLKDRGQPPVTFNRIKRKINTICGIIEKLQAGPQGLPAESRSGRPRTGRRSRRRSSTTPSAGTGTTRSTTVARRIAGAWHRRASSWSSSGATRATPRSSGTRSTSATFSTTRARSSTTSATRDSWHDALDRYRRGCRDVAGVRGGSEATSTTGGHEHERGDERTGPELDSNKDREAGPHCRSLVHGRQRVALRNLLRRD